VQPSDSPSGPAHQHISDNRERIPEPVALVVGTDDWAIEQGAEALEESGVRVLRCHEPGQPAFPCNALRGDGVCPLTVGFDVVVSMRGRPLSPPPPAEFGAVCGIRVGAPLIVAGLTRQSPFEPWTAEVVDIADDLPDTVRRIATRSLRPTRI
jgi:hypothetical protein